MANHVGNEGIVQIGAAVVAEVRSWSIEETAETADTSVMGPVARTHKVTKTTWSGSLECFWDETDSTGQGALTKGASVQLDVYPEGNTSGDVHYVGTATVTQVTKQAAHDGIVEAAFTFQGNGDLAEQTVV
ncbi:hypothetical protein [Pelagibius sp.]|uniref:hypothetical protein n=1 Tax=Pelagibius sp. TaxID=1931238 RepID=UPI002639585C|nr:hypothetical protein [Pelagibius sp.]